MAGNVIGEAFVAIRPETSGFGGDLESKLGGLGNALPIVGGIAAAGVAAGAALFAVGEKFEDSFHKIQQATGATGPALDKLEGSFKTVLSTTIGANFENVTAALSEVSIRSGLSGKALDALTQQFVELQHMDPSANIEQLTGIMGLFNVKAADQSKELDVLFKAHQLAGVSVGQLSADMQTAAPVAQTLGLNINQTAAIVAQLDKINLPASKTMMALSTEFSKAAKAGKDPTAVIGDLISTIERAPNAGAAAAIAISQFGLSARSASTFVAAARSGALNLSDAMSKITAGGGGINATAVATASLGDKFSLLKNKVLVALEPIAMKVVELANNIAEKIPGAVSKLWADIQPILSDITNAWSEFMAGFDNPSAGVGGVKGFVRLVIEAGQDIRKTFDTIRQAWDGFINGFNSGGIGQKLSGVSGAFQHIGADLKAFFKFVEDNKGVFIALAVVMGGPVTVSIALGVALVKLYQSFEPVRVVVKILADLVKNELVFAFKQAMAGAQFIIGVLGDLIKFVTDIFQGKWGKAWDAISDIPKRFEKLLKETIGNVIQLFTSIASQIGPTLLSVGSTILSFFASLPGKILTVLGHLAGSLISAFASAIGSLVSALPGLAEKLFLWWVTMPIRIVALLADAAKFLIPIGIHLVEGLVSGLVNALPKIASWIAQLPGRLLSFAASAATWMIQTGINIITSVITGLIQAVPGIATWFAGLPGRLANLAGEALTWLTSVGQNIIMGIIHGIESMSGAIGNAIVKEIKKIPGASTVIHWLGGSPAPFFYQFGENMMQGIAVGVGNSKALQPALTSKVGGVKVPALAAGVSAGGSAAARTAGLGLGLGAGPTEKEVVDLLTQIRDYLSVLNSNAPLSHISVHAAPGQSAEHIGTVAARQSAWDLRTTTTITR